MYDHFTFAGIQVERIDECYLMHQTKYGEKMQEISKSANLETFRSMRHRLVWISHTRPYLASTANIISQMTAESYNFKYISIVNNDIERAKETSKLGLLQQDPDKQTLRMILFSDSSFENNDDSTTQLGFIVLLNDGSKMVNLVHFESNKSKRGVRSVLGAET